MSPVNSHSAPYVDRAARPATNSAQTLPKADSPLAIMTDVARKVKAPDRAKLIDRRPTTPVFGNLYYLFKRVRGVI
jgi:hypothetical protein